MQLLDYFISISNQTSLAELQDSGAIVIISPHPDDDVIGMGGYIAALASQRQHRIVVIYMTDGSGSIRHESLADENVPKLRKKEACEALKRIGADAAFFLESKSSALSSQNLQKYTKVKTILRAIFQWLKPYEVYVTAPYERHPTHLRSTEITIEILREIKSELSDEFHLWGYPVWGPILGLSQKLRYEDIDKFSTVKNSAILAHTGEVAYKPYHEGAIQRNRYQAIFYEPHHRCLSEYAEIFLDMTELLTKTSITLQEFAIEQAKKYIQEIYV